MTFIYDKPAPLICRRNGSLCLLVVAILTFPQTVLPQDNNEPDSSRLLFELAPIYPDDNQASGSTESGGLTEPTSVSSSPDARNEGILAGQVAQPLEGITQYEEAIQEIEETEGLFAQNLPEFLRALGSLQESQGEHLAAIATFERAMHIERINKGLHTLDQEPLVRDIIRNYEVMGDFDAADDRREYLFFIHQKNYDGNDPEMVAAKLEWANWNVIAFYRQLEEQGGTAFITQNTQGVNNQQFIPVFGPNGRVSYLPRRDVFGPGVVTANSYMQSANATPANMQILQEPRLRTARDLYQSIIDSQTDNPGISDPGQLDSEERLANITYIIKQQDDILQDQLLGSFSSQAYRARQTPPLISRGYINSRRIFEDRIASIQNDPNADPELLARAQLDLADWLLTFGRHQAAVIQYQQAYEQLKQAGYPDQEIDSILSPQPAILIPTFATHPYSRRIHGIDENARLDYQGHIDLKIGLNRYGDVRGVEVLATSENTPYDVRRALLELIRDAQMRPHLDAGEAVSRDEIQLRYYYSYVRSL